MNEKTRQELEYLKGEWRRFCHDLKQQSAPLFTAEAGIGLIAFPVAAALFALRYIIPLTFAVGVTLGLCHAVVDLFF